MALPHMLSVHQRLFSSSARSTFPASTRRNRAKRARILSAMAAAAADEVPVPPQYKEQPRYDFRHFPDETRGFKVGVTKWGKTGTKRKLEEYAEQVEMERDAVAMDEGEAAGIAEAAEQMAKRAKHNVLGLARTSGRAWKVPGQRAGTLKNPKLSTSWEKKMQVKAEETAFKERKRSAKAEAKEVATAARLKKEAAKKRKLEAQQRSAITVRVTAATAKRMMKDKKKRKLLRTADVA